MKKIIFILALFVSFVANSQKTTGSNYTYFNTRSEWFTGIFQALGLPSGSGPAAFKAGQDMRAGALYYDSVGVDSGLHVWTGAYWRNYATASYTDADARAAISLTTTGTSGAATYSSATGVFNIPVYAGTLNANVGAFYRWLKPATQEIKTFAAGYGVLIDSTTNTDALTLDVDSLVIANRDWVMDRIADAEANLLVDTIGDDGISPITWWDNTIFGRRISISGGSIDTTASGGLLITVAPAGGITSLNTLTGATQTFATGTTGSDFNISSSGTTHTFNIPDAASTVRGLVTTGAQNWAGNKNFTGTTTTSGNLIATGGVFTSFTPAGSNLAVFSSAGGSSQTQAELLFAGATSVTLRTAIRGSTSVTPGVGQATTGFIVGSMAYGEQSSGNHPLFAGAVILAPTITGGAATVSNTATLYINDAPSATVSGGNYAIWSDAGVNRFDGLFNAGGTSLTANQIWGANSGATAMEGKTLTNGQNIKITHGAGTATFAGATLTKNATIESPTSSENMGWFRTPVAITITNTHAVLVGSGSPSVTYQISFGTDITSLTNVYTAGQTVTSTTTGTAASGVNDATIPADSWVRITTSAATDVTQISLSITYTED